MIWQICIFGLQKVTRRADERWQRLQEGSLHSFCLCATIVQTIYRWGGGGIDTFYLRRFNANLKTSVRQQGEEDCLTTIWQA